MMSKVEIRIDPETGEREQVIKGTFNSLTNKQKEVLITHLNEVELANFIYNYEKDRDGDMNKDYNDLYTIMCAAFIWDRTTQRNDYWSGIANRGLLS